MERLTSEKVYLGEAGWGEDVSGQIEIVGEWGTAKLDQLTIGCEGKIVVVADMISSTWAVKAGALGAIGIVSAGINFVPTPEVTVLTMPRDELGQMVKRTWEDLVKRNGRQAKVEPRQKKLTVLESNV